MTLDNTLTAEEGRFDTVHRTTIGAMYNSPIAEAFAADVALKMSGRAASHGQSRGVHTR